jgi:hypothetical protein
MAETTTEVRADIENTRARLAGAIAELERKADVGERVREHPWGSLALAFGAGLALGASRADVKAARAATAATKETGTLLGGALDGVLAAVIGGIVGGLHSRVDGMVSSVVKSRRDPIIQPGSTDQTKETPIRAD